MICLQRLGNSFCHEVLGQDFRVIWNSVSGLRRVMKKGELQDGQVHKAEYTQHGRRQSHDQSNRFRV